MLFPDDLDAVLESVLERAGTALTSTGIAKALPAGRKPKKNAKAQVQQALDRLVDTGRIYRWPGKERYSKRKFEEFATRGILEILDGAPASGAALAKHLSLTATHIQPLLRSLVDAGSIHRWTGKTPYYATTSINAFVQERVLRMLAEQPLSEAEIKKKLPKSATTQLASALKKLVKQDSIFEHPTLGAVKARYSLTPPRAIDYLPTELARLFANLAKLGFDADQVRAALHAYVVGKTEDAEPDLRETSVFAAMRKLNNQVPHGALVYIADLRKALATQFDDNASFDQALLALAHRGKVQLQTHPWPGRLSARERDELISDGRDGYFDAVGLRLE